jgi:hypothetical protein
VLTAYVVATCGPALFGRATALRCFGLGNLVVVSLLAWLDQNAVVSLWCVWAAATSILINIYVRDTEPRTATDSTRASEMQS